MQEKILVSLENNMLLKSENIEYNNTTLKEHLDSIIESGTNDKGSWIKYSNGIMICIMEIETTLPCETTWGSLFVGQDENVWNFPQEFIEIPIIIRDLQIKTNNSAWFINYSGPIVTKNSYKNFAIARATVSTGVPVKFVLLAKGRWK